MTNYTKTTNFTAKDTALITDTQKILRGSEFDVEFNAIATAISSKYDNTSTVDIIGGVINDTTIGATVPSSATFSSLTATTSTLTSPVINTGVSGTAVLDDDTFATASATTLATSESIKAYVDNSGGIAGITSTATSTQLTISNTTASFDKDIEVQGVDIGRGGSNESTNTAIGVSALNNNTTGENNTAVGHLSSLANTTSNHNTAVGSSSMQINTGEKNTAVGSGALSSNGAGGDNNTAMGYLALRTVGISVSASENTAVGASSAENTSSGYNNTSVGFKSLLTNTTGYRNTAVGHRALVNLTTAINNTAVGDSCLDSLSTGGSNTAIGQYSNYTTTTGSNNSTLGYSAQPSSATVSNEITLGDSAITTLRCQVGLTTLSDARDKTDVEPLSGASEFIKALNPVSFEWNQRDGNRLGQQDHGFIAQDLQAVQESTGYSVPRLVMDENPDKLEASYGTLLPTIVKALQEALVEIDELKAQLSNS